MSATNSYKARKAAIGGAYSLFPGAGAGCHYCGIPADTYDHVPALSKVYSLGVSEFEKKNIRLWIVPACNECNSMLTMCASDSVHERKRLVKKKLSKKYARYLRFGKWSADELDELGYNLRQAVEQGANISEWVRRRLAW